MMHDFISELQYRGFYYQCTNLEALKKITSSQKIAAYIGFDCTAKSLHVGNLMQIMIFRLLQKHGHKPIIVVGGTTTKIGDPTDKDQMRKILSDEEIANNMQGIKECFSKFIKFGDGPSDAIMVNNSDWLEKINYIDFLKNYGKFISVNKMLSQDSVKLRLSREQNLTFLEFNYMLFQAYDFYHLATNHDCVLQFGGSDQWGNIISGVDLVKRVCGKEVYGLTTPLIATSSGSKMGKSVNGAIWIHEKMLSPYDYFQFWRNIEDLDVIRFAKLYAEFDHEKQTEFEQLASNNINEAKKMLAHHLTAMCHSSQAADEALVAATSFYEEGIVTEGLPEFMLDYKLFNEKIYLFELFNLCGLSESKSAAKRLIRGGGAKINNNKIDDEETLVTLDHFNDDGYLIISSGKKNHYKIKITKS